jgi:ribosome assembly protein 4
MEIAVLRNSCYKCLWVRIASDISLRLENTCFIVFQVWDIRTHKLKQDLPGHADEVFCFFYLIVVHKQT